MRVAAMRRFLTHLKHQIAMLDKNVFPFHPSYEAILQRHREGRGAVRGELHLKYKRFLRTESERERWGVLTSNDTTGHTSTPVTALHGKLMENLKRHLPGFTRKEERKENAK